MSELGSLLDTVILGDCLDVLPGIPDASVDAVITDPPYLLGSASTRRGTRPQSPIADWVNASRWYIEWLSECLRVCHDDAPLWIHANWRSLPIFEIAVQALATRISSILVWDKNWPGVGSLSGLRNSYELVLLIAKPKFKIKDRTVRDIWTVPWSSARPNGHPQEKPLDLALMMIDVSNLKDEAAVLDPFIGSGTTAVAAVKTGKHFLGCDINLDYVDLAQRRIIRELERMQQMEMVLLGQDGK